jgi:hypothetical protein
MKSMQQHTSNVNVQGQPPEKRLRLTGSYNNGDPPNYDFQVNMHISYFVNKSFNLFIAKSQSTTTTTTATNVPTTISILVCSFVYK